MRQVLLGVVFTIIITALGLNPNTASADIINPWDFNVYSLGDIGTAADGYSSDFQGIAGTGGSAYFQSFSLHDVADAGPGTPFSLYAGGNVRLEGAIKNGGIEAAGDIAIYNGSVAGLIVGGGDLNGTSGHITGDVYLAGQKNTNQQMSIDGMLTEGSAFNASLDLDNISSYFSSVSQSVGSMATNGNVTNQWGQLIVEVSSGMNVVEVNSAMLAGAWGFKIQGPEDATVVINVTDENVSFGSIVWAYEGGVTSEDTLLNMPNATSFTLSNGGHLINILAPLADTEFTNGVLTGNLVVGNLTGSGQVNTGHFGGNVPEPNTLLLLGMGMFLVLPRGRRV